ncbi:MAG: VWA domain-containing protein [Chloroflexi bacterium]|nr:VWA domain-containing protein [Chloroflexota bacterium]
MPFLAPLALLGLLFVPVVLAMYLLKLRRDPFVVPSTLLWQRLVADVEANAPWQRLRRSLLLLLQLLLVVLLALLAARPFLERPAGLAGDVVVVLDTSASMAATDVVPNRLQAAKERIYEALRDLPSNGKVSVIAAGRTARVVVNGTTDLGRVRAAIDGVTVSPATGDLADALNLANALAARSGSAEILVATDAALASKPTARLDHPVTVLQVGRARNNQAIIALAVRPSSSGVTRSVFVSVANLDIESSEGRRVELYGDGILLEARDLMTLDPQTRTEVIVDDVPLGVSVLEARLTGGSPDALELDDRAWAIVPPDRLRRILLVSEGDPYLETALTYLPSTELYGVKPADYGPDTHPELFDLIIFEGFVPDELPAAAVLAIAPPETGPLGEVEGTLTDPAIGTLSSDEPILRYVDLSTTHIGKASKLVLPAWARTVIPGPRGSPLLYIGELDGRRAGVLAFLPRNSDLPLQVAFPVLVANLTGELLGGSAAPTTAIVPGDPVTLPLPAGATALVVTRPDGSTVELAPPTPGAGSVVFSQTDELGVYSAMPLYASPTAGPSASPTDAPTAPASPPPSAVPTSSGAPTAPPTDPDAPVRFAVDLFDPAESNIALGSAAEIAALGRRPGESPPPGASPTTEPTTTAAPTTEPGPSASPGTGGAGTDGPPVARDELWIPVVLLVLAVLLAEWLVYHRDAVTRLWRNIRPAPPPAPPVLVPRPTPIAARGGDRPAGVQPAERAPGRDADHSDRSG